jgi:hypothetical protein
MTHPAKVWPRFWQTRIARQSGQNIIVTISGRFAHMRFFVQDPGTVYRRVPYCQGLDNVTISELAAIQQEYSKTVNKV